jgi:hypothetical protein
VFDEATKTHLHGGCALLVGSVSLDGRPHASRGHGLTVLSDEPARVRLVLGANDVRTLENLQATGAIAITSGDVETLYSLQLKGEVERIEPATPDDIAKAAQYMEDFIGDIIRTDGYARQDLDEWLPTEFVACVASVREIFDQTPGPSAGGSFRNERV